VGDKNCHHVSHSIHIGARIYKWFDAASLARNIRRKKEVSEAQVGHVEAKIFCCIAVNAGFAIMTMPATLHKPQTPSSCSRILILEEDRNSFTFKRVRVLASRLFLDRHSFRVLHLAFRVTHFASLFTHLLILSTPALS
jgi:hypothetical protein